MPQGPSDPNQVPVIGPSLTLTLRLYHLPNGHRLWQATLPGVVGFVIAPSVNDLLHRMSHSIPDLKPDVILFSRN